MSSFNRSYKIIYITQLPTHGIHFDVNKNEKLEYLKLLYISQLICDIIFHTVWQHIDLRLYPEESLVQKWAFNTFII